MSQEIKYQDTKIIIEQSGLSTVSRIVIGVISLPGLCLGLIGCFEFAKLMLGLGDGFENTFISLFITIFFLVFPSIGVWLVWDSGKTLILDPETKQAHLTKRNLFRNVEKYFPFRNLKPCVIDQDFDNGIWSVKMKLPDKTRIDIREVGNLEHKKFSELWRDRINEMIKKD